jgi:enoyl-CoA hydratase
VRRLASERSVLTTKSGAITSIGLHRPATRNAVDQATAEALSAAFVAFEADEEARVAVLYGEGDTFCSGADLKELAEGRGNRVAADGDGPMGPTRMLLSKPVVAAVSGHAVAGGLELALWCDLRVMEEDAIFGVFSRRFGVPLIDGGTVRLPRLIGLSRALDLVLTARPVGAAEALAIGLCNRVVPSGRARAEAESLAQTIASFPQACLRADRRSAIVQWNLSLDEALAAELDGAEAALSEVAAGAQRFVDGEGRGGR